MSVKYKVGAIIGGFLFFILGAIGVTFWSVSNQKNDGVIINLAGRQRMLTQKMSKEALGVQKWGNEIGYKDKLKSTAALFDSTLKALRNGGKASLGNNAFVELPPTDSKEILKQLGEVDSMWKRFLNSINIVLTDSRKSDAFITGVENIEKISIPILKEMNKAVKMYEQESAKKINSLKTILSILFVAAIALTVFGLTMVQKMVVTPIKNVVTMLKDIATGEGDLTKRITVVSHDEIGELANWFNTFVEKVHQIVIQMSDSSLRVGAAAQEMAASIEEASATSNEIAKGAETQSVSVSESNGSIQEMGKAIKDVANSALQANEIAEKANEEAGKGGKAVENTALAMKEIEESSKKIEVIVGVITDIANQTNLLALNAAIEAAKAGEQGKGFAVVAEEVRKLAERSGESTKDIQALITESAERVQNGSKAVNEAGDALNAIIGRVQDTTALIEQISIAAEEQSAGADMVANSLDELSRISEHNASAATELSSTTVELAKAADELSGLGDDLTQIVSQFKIT